MIQMTERLYYDDAYLTEFDAVVTECREEDGKCIVRLDRSAFYPTSGGQPYDTGTLGDARVLDVYVGEDHDVYHVTDRPLAVGATVALSATLLGVSYNAGLPMGVAVLIALACGTCCGLLFVEFFGNLV